MDNVDPHLISSRFLAAHQTNSWDGRSWSQTQWPHVCKDQQQPYKKRGMKNKNDSSCFGTTNGLIHWGLVS